MEKNIRVIAKLVNNELTNFERNELKILRVGKATKRNSTKI